MPSSPNPPSEGLSASSASPPNPASPPMAAGAKVLVVDDEPAIVEAVAYNLRREGFIPLTASDADTALRLFKDKTPDVVILDVMLPSGSGFDVCRLIRKGGSHVPILMLTARIAEADRVFGLELGADDYLVKPFGMRELMARVKALLRRGAAAVADAEAAVASSAAAAGGSGSDGYSVVTVASVGLVLDGQKREARLRNEPLVLSRKEFDLLSLLASHPGRVFDRQTLLDRVWGQDAYVDDRTVDVHIRWLRQKIETIPSKPEYLLTVRGVGYKFQG